LGSGLRVALYHHVADQPSELASPLNLTTPVALFEAHIKRITRDYEIVDLGDVLAGNLPRRALLITFDDGYRSILDVALPILSKLELPSVFFISAVFVEPESLPLDNLLCWLAAHVGVATLEQAVTGRPAQGHQIAQIIDLVGCQPYERRMRLGDELTERYGVDRARLRAESRLFLDHGELPRLAELGCEVANHTQSHVFCRSIVDEPVGAFELVDHRHRLERWAGTPVRAFSYPYGYHCDATPLVERLLIESGHEASFLVESRPNPVGHPGRLWNRVSLDGRPLSRLTAELEFLPRLRAMRDLMTTTA
jgi:peptidoglycan/xylan/chitin deacetylase (PgdA/CDA1 family)